MVSYQNLLIWWAATISAGVIFQVLVSIYLYPKSRKKAAESTPLLYKLGKNFAFVWILLSLLVLYIVSINAGSYAVFVAGNIMVEVFMFIYVIKNSNK